MDRSRIAILIPALNEEKTILDVVKKSNFYGQSIVIDDGSTDMTKEIAKSAGAIVFSHKKNLGYDDALNTGFEKALSLQYEYIITLDADGQHQPILLKKFIRLLNDGCQLVLGVRNKKARFAEYLFGFLTKKKHGICDPLCGLKGYNRKVYELTGYFDSYKSIGTELMLKTVSNGLSFKQVFFQVKNRADKPRLGSIFFVNLKILRSLFIWLLKN